ncbi:endogenous inhibitor of DNA gyrase (YacG/DUF329 family) [Sinorhizobium terangae]|uniref:Uncharacterized protein n=1 Tax=Sinorhizobium terangae TaxID=110322 RepID=A0A6N7LNW4_SINTE|nr:hypothetical protein [Sinorhizobium terangae]MBB4188727.1 endogenous inhibitor of DNA gyrase (YacG/DUF329 family) [Sinorhizobium terangae]MQX18879.1 hypothetical protein [Sinorhizobium terangae]
MKIWYAGDKSKALCEKCRKVVTTTFDYHDVPFESGIGVAKQIMAATCDECGTVVAIAPQSTPAIRVAREIASQKRGGSSSEVEKLARYPRQSVFR